MRQLSADDVGLVAEVTHWEMQVPRLVVLDADPMDLDSNLSTYWYNYGEPEDTGYVAMWNGETIGAAWARIVGSRSPGHGHLTSHIPELTIAVAPDWRGQGVGTQLLSTLLKGLAEAGFSAVSLSVQKGNRAIHLYERFGFVTTRVYKDHYVMMRSLISYDDFAA